MSRDRTIEDFILQLLTGFDCHFEADKELLLTNDVEQILRHIAFNEGARLTYMDIFVITYLCAKRCEIDLERYIEVEEIIKQLSTTRDEF